MMGYNTYQDGDSMTYEIDSILITEDQLKQKVKQIGAQMQQDFQDEPFVLIIVLKGAYVFAADLIRELALILWLHQAMETKRKLQEKYDS